MFTVEGGFLNQTQWDQSVSEGLGRVGFGHVAQTLGETGVIALVA